MLSSIWKNRRVYLTGHTGFKGGWMALWLSQMGAKVHGYALAPDTTPNLFMAARVSERVDSEFGDIRDLESLERSVTSFAPEVIFHMAAQPLVRHSYADPIGTYSTNVMGTAHLLDVVRRTSSVRAVVVVTTDKCYENREWLWGYREDDRLGGHDPYSSSKACAELVASAYRSSFFPVGKLADHKVAIATARAGNVIGGGDWSKDRLVPDLLRGFLAGERVAVRHPMATRPWQHVLEPIAGYLKLAERLLAQESQFATGWNFGPAEEDAWPVSRIADTLAEAWGDGASWVQDAGEHPHEAGQLKLDTSKARSLLGWKPVLPLQEGLGWTVEWSKAESRGDDMHAFSLKQIAEYEARLKA